MPTKKKTATKTTDTPLHKLGDKLYFNDWTNVRPRVFFGSVDRINSRTSPVTEATTGKIVGTSEGHIYEMKCIGSDFHFDVAEYRLHKTFTSVAIEIARTYLVNIK